MSISVPSHLIALRDYLRANTALAAIASPANERILARNLNAITRAQHYVLLQSSGGRYDPYVPVRSPRVDLITIGTSEWEAKRLMWYAMDALGLHDRGAVPRIEDIGVIITDIMSEAEPNPSIMEDVEQGPGWVEVLPLIVTVHTTDVSA